MSLGADRNRGRKGRLSHNQQHKLHRGREPFRMRKDKGGSYQDSQPVGSPILKALTDALENQ